MVSLLSYFSLGARSCGDHGHVVTNGAQSKAHLVGLEHVARLQHLHDGGRRLLLAGGAVVQQAHPVVQDLCHLPYTDARKNHAHTYTHTQTQHKALARSCSHKTTTHAQGDGWSTLATSCTYGTHETRTQGTKRREIYTIYYGILREQIPDPPPAPTKGVIVFGPLHTDSPLRERRQGRFCPRPRPRPHPGPERRGPAVPQVTPRGSSCLPVPLHTQIEDVFGRGGGGGEGEFQYYQMLIQQRQTVFLVSLYILRKKPK